VKVIVFSNTSWNLFNFRLPLMSSLKDEGYEVVALAPRDQYSERVEGLGFRYIEIPMDNKGTNPVQDIKLMLRLYRIFKLERPDIVLTYTPKSNIYGSIVSGLMGIPLVPNISGLGNVFIRKSIVTHIVKILYRLALSFPKVVFFQNFDDLNLFVDLGLVKKESARRIPGSGINTSVYSPKEGGGNKTSFAFLLVARMLWDKGVGEYIDAARAVAEKHENVHFRLLGFLDVENPQAVPRAQMQEWVDEGVVQYDGESDDVISHILKADCVVLPSYREGLPRTLLEASSLARPVITTDVPGCRDVVDHGVTGYLCESRDAKDLASKMNEMLALSEDKRQEMGCRARDKVIHEFDEGIVIDMYVKVVREIKGDSTVRS